MEDLNFTYDLVLLEVVSMQGKVNAVSRLLSSIAIKENSIRWT
jgi:hypothetical protein